MKTILFIASLLIGILTFAQDDLLIYYGYPSSFNHPDNSWNVSNVINDMKKYDLIVLADGLQETAHTDHTNTVTIINGLDTTPNNPTVFGYVTINQDCCDFIDKVNKWVSNLNVDGIFLDEAGYDYGTTSTNSREKFNIKVDYVHLKGKLCFANAWNLDHVMTIDNDPSYPNSTWNPDSLASSLNSTDWLLMESYLVNTLSYVDTFETSTNWNTRIQRNADYSINIAGVGVIDNNNATGQDKFDFLYNGSIAGELDAIGSSDHNYAASSAIVKYWNRNVLQTTANTSIVKDSIASDSYLRKNTILYKIDFDNKESYQIK